MEEQHRTATFSSIASSVDLSSPRLPPILSLEDLAIALNTSKEIARRMLDTGVLEELPIATRRVRRVAAMTLLRFFDRSETERLARLRSVSLPR
jgi:hypothetical protein